ncbi:MAG: HemK/PrmC family methyltransferase [Candidatus Margulisiibacteriota bacterium]
MNWTIASLLQWTQDYFQKHEVDSPRLTAELLLADVLKANRLDLYLRYDAPVAEDELAAFKKYIQQRVKGEPIQYILGKAWFMGMEFGVSLDVLIPRPETEILVEKVVDWFRDNQPVSKQVSPLNPPKGGLNTASSEVSCQDTSDLRFCANTKSEIQDTKSEFQGPPLGGFRGLRSRDQLSIVDVGTGSGCIAISLAKFIPEANIHATDISQAAINIALKNAELHKVNITFKKGNLLSPVMESFSNDQIFIVSNPPYVTEQEWIGLQREVKDHEPDTALLAGEGGLEYYRKIIDQSQDLSIIGFAFEVGIGQAQAVADMGREAYPDYKIDIFKDLEQVDRIVIGYRL